MPEPVDSDTPEARARRNEGSYGLGGIDRKAGNFFQSHWMWLAVGLAALIVILYFAAR